LLLAFFTTGLISRVGDLGSRQLNSNTTNSAPALQNLTASIPETCEFFTSCNISAQARDGLKKAPVMNIR